MARAPKQTVVPIGERIASLDAAFTAHAAADAASYAAITAALAMIQTDVSEMKRQQSRQKGFVAGVIFVVSALWGLVVVALKFLPIKP